MKPLAVLIANPAARGSAEGKLARAVSLIEERGYECELLLTSGPGDATTLARHAASKGDGAQEHIVIAAGGDGTFNEVMNGLVGTDVPMGILPMGTANVLAKEVGLPETVEGAVQRALTGKAHGITVGRVVREGMESRHFFLVAGVGFDAEAVLGMNRTIKRYSGKAAYVLSALKNLPGWSPAALEVMVDGVKMSAYTIFVCNAARYGGQMKAAPGADISSPYLRAVLFHGPGRLDTLRYACGLLRGRHTDFKDVSYVECSRVEVRGEAHMQMDGEYTGKSPAVIESVPGALRLVF